MPSFSFNVDVPAGGSIPNALAGSPFEFMARNGQVAVALTTVLLGVDVVTTNVLYGGRLQLQTGSVPVERTVGGGAILPDNVQADDVAAGGERITIELLNSDLVNHRVRGIVRILEM